MRAMSSPPLTPDILLLPVPSDWILYMITFDKSGVICINSRGKSQGVPVILYLPMETGGSLLSRYGGLDAEHVSAR
jgi:hypothetical protein